MKIHYYMICARFEALIASHLEPEAFGLYMAVGTKKLASGRVTFFEIDPAGVGPYFGAEEIEKLCAPHLDGSARASKYLKTYRVLEHLDLSAFGQLFLTTADGRTLALDAAPYDVAAEQQRVHMYQELCPLIPLVVSGLGPAAFAKRMTDPKEPVSAPRLFFADLKLEFDADGALSGALPYSDPLHIMECIRQLKREGTKTTKTVSRTPRTQGFFRAIDRGFFLGDQTGLKHFPLPPVEDLEIHHRAWWHSAKAAN